MKLNMILVTYKYVHVTVAFCQPDLYNSVLKAIFTLDLSSLAPFNILYDRAVFIGDRCTLQQIADQPTNTLVSDNLINKTTRVFD